MQRILYDKENSDMIHTFFAEDNSLIIAIANHLYNYKVCVMSNVGTI